MPNDIKTVAKVVLIDKDNRILMLKRSDYMDRFAGEWDLPGGHLKQNESLFDGLCREVKEETGLSVENPKIIEIQANMHFFYAKYTHKPIELSHEHTDFKFFDKNSLNGDEKFQKIAIKALEMNND
mgnify:CR=1 FL=1